MKCNTDLRKTSSIFITGANGRNKSMEIRGLVECDKCRLCREQRETVYHLSSGCKKLAGTEYVKRHSNALKVLVIEKDGMKLFWDWEHPMRTDGIARRSDLTLEDTPKKTILLIDMLRPNKNNKIAKRDEKIGKYSQLCFELRERQEGYTVKVVPTIIGCLGGGMKELKESIREIFEYKNNDKKLEWISREMQKTVL